MIKTKKDTKILLLTAIVGLLVAILLFGLWSENADSVAFAINDHCVEKYNAEIHDDYDHVYMSDERDYILNTSNIEIPFTVKTKSVIKEYSYDGNFSVFSVKRVDSYNLVFSLFCEKDENNLELRVKIILTDGRLLSACLYAVNNEYGLFISRFSQEDALEKYLRYALKNCFIESWQAEQIRYENERRMGENEETKDTIKSTVNVGPISLRAAASGDTYVHGTLKWRETESESSQQHALRKVKVEVRDSDLIGSQLLGTVYTDDNGYYSLSFTNDSSILENGGCDLFIRVYAGDDNAYVVQSDGNTRYYVESNHESHQNVATGSDTGISLTFRMTSDSRKAFQISQALITARDYAKAMRGTNPHYVKVRYPYGSDGCYYNSNSYMITITGDARKSINVPESYASWDVIMHEYGHHIAHCQGIDDSPGGWHSSACDMIGHYVMEDSSFCDGECAVHRANNPIGAANAKEAAHKLIWSEAWATTFAFIAQEYSAEYIGTVPTVCNESYDAYNFYDPYDFQYEAYCNRLGENSEVGVYAALWDLFDTNNTSYDNLSRTYQQWWDITTISGTYTFSEFMNQFYAQFPELAGDMGEILARYSIAPYLDICAPGVSELGPRMTSFDIRYFFAPRSVCFEYDEFYVTVYSEDYSQKYTSPLLTSDRYAVSSVTFSMVEDFKGEIVHIMFKVAQSGNEPGYPSLPQGIRTGPYYSRSFSAPKRLFKTTISSGQATITDTYCDLSGEIVIPAYLDGYPVTKIGNYAFEYQDEITIVTFEDYSMVTSIGSCAFLQCTNLSLIRIPDNVTKISASAFAQCGGLIWTHGGSPMTEIGDMAFYETTISLTASIESSVTKIGLAAFYQSGLTHLFHFPANTQLNNLGASSFANNDSLPDLIVPQSIATIGANAFNGCSTLTIYTDAQSKLSGWNSNWNSSNRPVFWECTLSSDKTYVVSFKKKVGNPSNINATNGISDPFRDGYNFNGWYTLDDNNNKVYHSDLSSISNGDTVYADWVKKSCVAEGTLITLADGSQVAVEDLTGEENLLVWNMLTGEYDAAPILFIDSDPSMIYEVIELTFSDGTVVKVIDEHAFFDMTTGEYVFLRNDAAQYIGHYFNKQGANGTWASVQLTGVNVYGEITMAWSPVTYGHLCYYVNGMLSMPGATEGFINIFEVDTSLMQYDEDLMEEDILTYGLYTYEEFNAIIPLPELVFEAFNGQYLKVSIGKGLITLDEIAALLNRYAVFFN